MYGGSTTDYGQNLYASYQWSPHLVYFQMCMKLNVFDQLARKLQTGFVPGMDDAQPTCVLALLELH